MDAEKIKLVQAFNIEAFLDWQEQFYEPLPEWVEEEKTALEEKVLNDWQNFMDAIKENRQPQAETKHEQSQEAQQLLNEHQERRQTVELLERLETPILDASYFFGLKNGTIGGIQIEIESIQKKAARGITSPEMIIEKRLAESLEFIDLPLLDWMTKEGPILERHGLMALQTLIEIGVCQWILEQATEAQTAEKARQNRDEWTLPYKICLLNQIGFFDLPRLEPLLRATGKRNELVSLLLGADFTNTKKNINGLRTGGVYDPKKHLNDVETYLKEILQEE